MNECQHIELSTDNPTKASAFYASLFGWKIEAMPMAGGGEYLMFRAGNGGGGIAAKQMPQQPTAWTPYITVASVKDTLKAAKSGGGSVLLDYTSLGEMGAIAVIADPTGGAIGLYEAGAAAAPAPAKKAAPKKAAPKKAAPKKAAPKKAAAKKAPAKPKKK